ncbi:MAG: ImmA/IrrE family metallo-endopeptidase [Deltaproteobacteria bacterium]|nr:MAG: ImmA/IrrE family metallo-endopeptidase [Deltaproteobacteria bacterium]
MGRVAINEGVLLWAIDRAGLTPDGLESKFPKIRQWVDGAGQPTRRQLESLAKVTLTPLGFFFLPEPPKVQLPIPHFRTLGDKTPSRPSPNLIDTIQLMQRRQDWMREFLIEEGQEPSPIAWSAQPDAKPVSVADHIRHALRLDEGWAAHQRTWEDALSLLRQAMEDAGILVFVNGVVENNTHRKLDTAEFRGFVLVDKYAPLVFVNGVDAKAAQMFTLAHELAHVFFGSSAAFDLREMQPADDPVEKACNQVAAEFLVPERKLRQFWPSIKNDPGPFQAIAKHFKISVLVAARRALDLQLIKKEAFFDFYHAYREEEKERRQTASQKPGGDFYRTQNSRVGRPFASAVASAVIEGKLLYSEAYRLTGLYGNTFDSYLKYLRSGKR